MSPLADFSRLATSHVGIGPAGILPGAVIGMANTSGKTLVKAYGSTRVDSNDHLKEDAVMWMASCTKLLTSIAAIQCVEKGLFTLDEDVSRVLPEFKDKQILTGFVDNKPVYKAPKNPVTLRLLLSHRSGMCYDAAHPLLIQWQETVHNRGPQWIVGDLKKAYDIPLVAEPGAMWMYSPGIDWAGQMVARASGSNLEDYMIQNIFKPLGMTSTTFRPTPALLSRRMPLSTRAGHHSVLSHDPLEEYGDYPIDAKDECGGAGLYSTAGDYLKVLASILKDDGKLLNSESVNALFEPQMADPSQYQSIIDNEYGSAQFSPGIPSGCKFNHGLGGSLNMSGAAGHAGKQTLTWGGLPNLGWMIDRSEGVAGIFATQLVPPGEPRVEFLKAAFWRLLHDKWSK